MAENDDVIESGGRRQITLHNRGDTADRFKKGDFPTGVEYSEEEKMEMFRQKNYAVISVEIRAKSGKLPFTMLADDFNLYLTTENIPENTEVIQKKLQNLIPQIGALIERWTSEMK